MESNAIIQDVNGPCRMPNTDHDLYIHKQTRREYRERLAANEIKCVILPIAAIEQHLEHMAMEHDWRSVNVIAKGVAEQLRPHVVIAQGVMAGVSEHHMRHPGTLTLSPGTFLSVVNDLIDSIVRTGVTNVLVLNGHGGNIEPMRLAWDQFLRRYQVNLQFLPYWDVLTDADAELLATQDIPGHAQEFETAFALAEFPENVRQAALNDQTDPTPGKATAEAGRELIDRVVDRVSTFVNEMIDGKRVAEVPDFHP